MSNLKPHLEIVEQPANCGIRFRYLSEKRFGGTLQGEKSSNKERTYPKIKMINYSGPLIIIISAITIDSPFMQHPNIIANELLSADVVYKKKFYETPEVIELDDLKIYKPKRREIKMNLLSRRDYNIDPTNAGFGHIESELLNINLDKIRLCFQAFYQNKETKLITEKTEPVISEELFNRRDNIFLHIYNISTTNIPSCGGQVMMFTSHITKDDIEIIMLIENNGLKSERKLNGNVHKKVGAIFYIPPYEYPNNARFEIMLKRPSDEMISSPIEFEYYPAYQPITVEPEIRSEEKVNEETQTHDILELPDPSEFPGIDMIDSTDDSLEQIINNSELIAEVSEFHDWLPPFDDI